MSGRVAREARRARVEAAGDVIAQDDQFGITVRRNRAGRTSITLDVSREPVLVRWQADQLRQLLDQLEVEQVIALRAAGWSWDDVAMAWEMSRAGAAKRFAGVDDVVRERAAAARAARSSSAGVPTQRGPARPAAPDFVRMPSGEIAYAPVG